jgi:hypothetical protein
MASESSVQFGIHIPADEYLKYYKGTARAVHAQTIDGRSVQFPANVLQPFVTRDGITGQFVMYFDQDNKFLRIEKVR